ncbi:MAG: DUF4345 family protein, partial [Gammaproteobacteria bacterium]|nr:DUF4345 family protein [Gammaproteobacteria bacterium]
SALLFVAYGLTGMVSPAIPAGFAGLGISSGDAFAEVGAMYGGLQIGIGLFMALAAWRPAYYRAGLVLLVLGIGMLALARLYFSLITEQAVTGYTYTALIYESVTATLAALSLKNSKNP